MTDFLVVIGVVALFVLIAYTIIFVAGSVEECLEKKKERDEKFDEMRKEVTTIWHLTRSIYEKVSQPKEGKE